MTMKQTEQAYMEKLFPGGRELPANRLIPCLLVRGHRTEVVFLYKADSETAARLTPDRDALVLGSEIAIHALPTAEDGEGFDDLRIGMALEYPEGEVRFTGMVSDPTGAKQASVAKALLLVNRVALFVADEAFGFIAFKAFDWNPASQPVLEEMLRRASGQELAN